MPVDLDRILAPAVESDPRTVREMIVTAVASGEALSTLRARIRDETRTQAIADRIVQEVCIEDNRVDNWEVLRQMPLVKPEADLGTLTEGTWTLSYGEDEIELIRKERRLWGFHNDGRAKVKSERVQTLEFPPSEFLALKRFLKRTKPPENTKRDAE